MSRLEGAVLVDTSAWIDALRQDGDAGVREAVRAVTAEGRAVFCDMVRLELWSGAGGESERGVLRELERELEVAPTTPDVWEAAMDLSRACREQGITVPVTDVLIAACAQHHGLSLLHHDSHFDRIARIAARSEPRS